MCHDQLAVAVYGIEQFGGVAADMLFHFDAWVKYILVVEFQLGVVSVEVQSVQHNRVLFSFHDFGPYSLRPYLKMKMRACLRHFASYAKN